MPLDLGHDIARLVPAMRLVAEAGVVTSYLVRWSPDWRVTTRLERFPGSAPGYGHYARRYHRQDTMLEIACSRCERCARFQVRDGCRQIDHCAGAAAVTKCPISGRIGHSPHRNLPGMLIDFRCRTAFIEDPSIQAASPLCSRAVRSRIPSGRPAMRRIPDSGLVWWRRRQDIGRATSHGRLGSFRLLFWRCIGSKLRQGPG